MKVTITFYFIFIQIYETVLSLSKKDMRNLISGYVSNKNRLETAALTQFDPTSRLFESKQNSVKRFLEMFFTIENKTENRLLQFIYIA